MLPATTAIAPKYDRNEMTVKDPLMPKSSLSDVVGGAFYCDAA
jgi:hypothetical protein